jgi:hypothetical protein
MENSMTDYKKKAEEIVDGAWNTCREINIGYDEALIPSIEQALLEAYAEGRKSVLNEFPKTGEVTQWVISKLAKDG